MPSAIGIDIGGTHLRAARVAAGGRIETLRREPVDPRPEALAARIEALAGTLDAHDVAGIGLGIPGRVDARACRALSGGHVDLSGFDLAGRLGSALGRRVVMENDATMALLAEAALGAARGHRDVVLLTIGTGVGGAVLEGGHVLRGRASAGQLGHIGVPGGDRPCACGRRGCIETVASGTALRRTMTEAGLPPTTSIEALLAGAADDGPGAGVVGHWAAVLRQALDSCAAAFDPSLIVLGGGLGAAATLAVSRTAPGSTWFSYETVAATLGDEAGVVGAALAAGATP